MTTRDVPFAHVVIRASAGTGKTYQLSNRLIGLLAAGQPPDSILASTFARKAAGEILQRVLVRLAEACVDNKKLTELDDAICEVTLNRTRCAELLQLLTRQLHRLRIGTLDSFFVKLVGSFGMELGLPPGWQIVDELTNQRLRAAAIQQVLEEESTSRLVTLLHLLAKGEVKRTVWDQISEIVTNLYANYQDSAPDAWQKLPRPPRLSDAELETAIEAVAAVELPKHKQIEKDRQTDVERARAGQWEEFVSKGIPNKIANGDSRYRAKPISPEMEAVYRRLIDHAAGVLISDVANQTEATRQLLERFDAAFQRLKTTRRGFRFDDVTRRLVDGFAGPLRTLPTFRLDSSIDHLLLDEFQDTSVGQWTVLRPFARRVTLRNGSFFCVGDAKQAIYGWRGGVSELFGAIEEEIEGLSYRSLSKSWRSSPVIIDVVNRVFGNLKSNAALESWSRVADRWTDEFETHETERKELSGYARLETAPREDQQTDQNALTCRHAAKRVAELAKQHPSRTIGVLVRKNEAVSNLIRELHRLGVLASEEGGNPLTDSAAVRLILSLLKIADHPGDTIARFHVAESPLAKQLHLSDYTDHLAASRLSSRIRQQLISDGYGPTVYQTVQHLAEHVSARELNRCLQLVELAYRYEDSATVRVDHFIEYIEATKVEDPTASSVRVMTVHQAKGLEFDIVVLPELDVDLKGQPPKLVTGRASPVSPIQKVCRYVNDKIQPLFPADFRRLFDEWPDQFVNESLCLLYVAMTRAVHALYVILAPTPQNQKTFPKTYAGVLRAALTDGSPLPESTTVFETGDKNWDRQKSAVATREPAVEELTVRLAKSTTRRRGLDRKSPSGLEGGDRVRMASLLRMGTRFATIRGEIYHAWFEEIAWLDEGVPADDVFRKRSSQFGDAGVNIDSELKAFRAALKHPAIRRALSRTGYAEPAECGFSDAQIDAIQQPNVCPQVYREFPFAVRDGDELLPGFIDRLVVFKQGETAVAAEVIDFKTDQLDGDDQAALAEKVAHYRPQLRAYCRVVCRMFHLEQELISARLIFVGPKLTVPVQIEDD